MLIRYIILIRLFLLAFPLNAQQPALLYDKTDCIRLSNVDSYYEAKQFDSSIHYIHLLLNAGHLFKEDRRLLYKLFRCYRSKQMTDSAFHYLQKAVTLGYTPKGDYNMFDERKDILVFNDARNKMISKRLAVNEKRPRLNKKLVRQIRAIGNSDQEVRKGIDMDRIKNDKGYSGLISARMRHVDSINTLELKRIVDKYGWPGYSVIGREADMSLWAAVQHADKDVAFQEYVLQLIGASILMGNTHKKHYAYLYDRICVNKGLPQLFGTQVEYSDSTTMKLHVLQDSAMVDYYRYGYDMTSLAEYRKQYMSHFYDNKR